MEGGSFSYCTDMNPLRACTLLAGLLCTQLCQINSFFTNLANWAHFLKYQGAFRDQNRIFHEHPRVISGLNSKQISAKIIYTSQTNFQYLLLGSFQVFR